MECLYYLVIERLERCIVTPAPSYLYTDPYFSILNRTTQPTTDSSIPTPKLSELYIIFFTPNRSTQPIRDRGILTPKLLPLTEPLSQSEAGLFQLPNFLCCIIYP